MDINPAADPHGSGSSQDLTQNTELAECREPQFDPGTSDAPSGREMASMRIMFLAANPQWTSRLDLDKECRAVRLELRATRFRERIDLIVREAVCPDDLLREVREHHPNIIHFSGHGETEGIFLENESGKVQPVDGESLARFFAGRGIDLVVLNSCYSSLQAEQIQRAVKAVMGTTRAVRDEDARRFAIAFYRSLGNGLPLGAAFRDGTDEVVLYGGGDVFQIRGEMGLQLIDPGLGIDSQASLRVLPAIEIVDHKVKLADNYEIIEPAVGSRWHEAVCLTIARLKPQNVEEMIEGLLPGPSTSRREARARTVFALQCMVGEPEVSERVALAALDAAIDCLQEGDGFVTTGRTRMDEALIAVARSKFQAQLRDRLLRAFIQSRGDQRSLIGGCMCLGSGLRDLAVTSDNADAVIRRGRLALVSDSQAERVNSALDLMNRFFANSGRLGFLTSSQQSRISIALLSALSEDDATRCAAMWALAWLTGAKNRVRGPKLESDMVLLEPWQIAKLEQVLQDQSLDPLCLGNGCQVLSREKGLSPVMYQIDWIYELARIADGAIPRRMLPAPRASGRSVSVGWIKDLLARTDLPPLTRAQAAQTLGCFGIYDSGMVKPLQWLFRSEKFAEDVRDEALVYLGLIGTPEVAPILIEAADSAPVQQNDYLYPRGLFGLLLLDNVDVLAQQVRKGLPHSDIVAYAYGLAGSRNPQGLVLLKKLASDPNERIRNAARKALARPWVSD